MSRSPASGPFDPSAHGPAPLGLAVGVQPHGLLLVVHEPHLRIVQASTSAAALLRRPLDSLLLASVHDLGGNLGSRLRAMLDDGPLPPLQPLQCTVGDGANAQRFDGSVQRTASGALVLELEPLLPPDTDAGTVELPRAALLAHLSDAVRRFGEAASVAALAAAAASAVRALLCCDRVIVSEFDAEWRGHIVAEALDPQHLRGLARDDALAEMPHAAREALLRQRLHVLVDVDAASSTLLPELPPGNGGICEVAYGRLHSPSPGCAQQLRAQGVASSVTMALVSEGRLWGQVTCHHDRPRKLGQGMRAAIELLAEAFGTRVLALESYARAQVMAEVRRLEQRLLDATSLDGDWQAALLRHQLTLLEPLTASGALLCHEGQTLACGQVPSGAARQALLQWLHAQPAGTAPVHCAALDAAHPARRAGVCGVLAVRLSQTQPEALLWLRPEHGQAGRSLPWTRGDISLAAAFGAALADMMLQVNAVRLLIAESHLARVRAAVAGALDAVVVSDAAQQACYANAAFHRLLGLDVETSPARLGALSTHFTEPELVQRIIGQVRAELRPWRGELALRRADGSVLPVAVRAEPVPASDHALLGTIFIFEDLSDAKRADAARTRLDAALSRTHHAVRAADGQALLDALLANAGLAAMDIAEGGAPAAVPPLLDAVEASTARAAALLARIEQLAHGEPD